MLRSENRNRAYIFLHASGVLCLENVQTIVPFNSQQEFLKSYPKIINPLVGSSGREIKYGDLLNTDDRFHRKEAEEICRSLLMRFFEIKDARIVRVKAIRKQIPLETAYQIVDKKFTLDRALQRKQT